MLCVLGTCTCSLLQHIFYIALISLHPSIPPPLNWQLGTPLFITFSQCAVALICFVILGLFSSKYPDSITFPTPEINLQTQIKVSIYSVVVSLSHCLFNYLFVYLLLSAGASFVSGICWHDRLQQSHAKVPGCGLLQCWAFSHNCLQCCKYLNYTVYNCSCTQAQLYRSMLFQHSAPPMP